MPIILSQENDGSAGAPVGGSFQRADFFTYARQSGQPTYAVRPPWRVAGVDYAVGIPSASFPLKQVGVDSLPSGASDAGGGVIAVNMSAADVTFNGWDLSGRIIAGDVNPANGHKLTVKNTLFAITNNGGSGVGIISEQGANIVVEVDCCEFRGNSSTYTSSSWGTGVNLLETSSSSLLMTYCSFIDWPSAPARSSSYGNVVQKYNYVEFNVHPTDHAELCALQSPDTTNPISIFRSSYNTVFTSALSTNINGVTGNLTIFVFPGAIINQVQNNNNTLISNLHNGNAGEYTAAFLGVISGPVAPPGGVIKQMTWDSNYGDPTGSFTFFSNGGGVTRPYETFRNNRSLIDNSIISGYT